MNGYIAYIRVSTVKQGQGVSPQEQRSAIAAYAAREGLSVIDWYEEKKTAAKPGRAAFNRLVADLTGGRAAGVIVHKIDRSMRNLHDWALIGELIDSGVDVRFAHENLDLTTRGGRLAADIQAVVAADFIRNLRDEVHKGQDGRLKQGLYPWKAPRGYLDRGKGRAKEIDPVLGPLVRQAFELYATGNYGLHALRLEMATRGLRSERGGPLGLNAISLLLRNPFYTGLIRVRRTGKTYPGIHEPLIRRAVFDRVQAILSGRLYPRTEIHRYLFRRLIKCSRCGRSLTGERQKGHVYYRCHDLGCNGVSVREKDADLCVRQALAALAIPNEDQGDLVDMIRQLDAADTETEVSRGERIARDLALVTERLARLTDALVDGLIDKAAYESRRAALLARQLELQQQAGAGQDSTFWKDVLKLFELGFVAYLGYECGNDDEKREVLKSAGSNLIADGKKLVFPMSFPFEELREWSLSSRCAEHQGAVRTTTRDKRRVKLHNLIRNIGARRGCDHREAA